jgi:hypothetical protein
VIKSIYEIVAQDEARHAGAYLRYMKRALHDLGEASTKEAKRAFAKIGVLMASAKRTSQALHPTNLHVNREMFPDDTVQSKLPEPGWLEHWLDTQIQFNGEWENKVASRILHNLAVLFNKPFETVQDLNRFRKSLDKPAQSPAAA